MGFPRSGVVLVSGLACVLSVPPAWADLYRWVAEDGTITISDTPPKDRSLIAEVFPTASPSQPSAPPAPVAAAQQLAELRALNERFERLAQVLEDERRFSEAQSFAPPPPPYVPAGPPMWNGWN